MKQNLKHVLEIGEAATDPKVKMQARAIENDCYRFILDTSTNARIISDAMKYVTRKQEQIGTMKKLARKKRRLLTEYSRLESNV